MPGVSYVGLRTILEGAATILLELTGGSNNADEGDVGLNTFGRCGI